MHRMACLEITTCSPHLTPLACSLSTVPSSLPASLRSLLAPAPALLPYLYLSLGPTLSFSHFHKTLLATNGRRAHRASSIRMSSESESTLSFSTGIQSSSLTIDFCFPPVAPPYTFVYHTDTLHKIRYQRIGVQHVGRV